MNEWSIQASRANRARRGPVTAKRHGTNSTVLQRNFLFAGGIYRPASFFTLTLRMTWIRLYTIPYMQQARSILYRVWGSFCPDESATRKAGLWRSLIMYIHNDDVQPHNYQDLFRIQDIMYEICTLWIHQTTDGILWCWIYCSEYTFLVTVYCRKLM